MAALTDNLVRPDRGVSVMEFSLGAGVIAFAGSYMAITSATGAVAPATGIAGEVGMGFAKTYADGDDPRGEPYTHTTIDTAAKIIEQLPVATLAGTAADRGKKVYPTSDNDFTVTDPVGPAAVGIVVKPIDANVADVAFFAFLDNAQHA